MSLSMVLTIKHDGERLCVGEEEKEGWGVARPRGGKECSVSNVSNQQHDFLCLYRYNFVNKRQCTATTSCVY